ncbi:unnamed protein product [Effrenium voratum]|nr:unnamed protein product [Effrenium voratum]
MLMAEAVLRLLLAPLLVLGKTCPAGCRCSTGPGGGDCGLTATCRKLFSFPKQEQYPEGLDCLFIHSPKLRNLPPDKMEAGLRSIPATVRRLDLSESRLRRLPGASLPPKLRVLNLEFNELEELPEDAFHGLSKLKVLWLTGNHYQVGEKGYKKMKVAGNRLQELPPRIFQGLSNLQVLLLHHNRMQFLPPGVFDELAKLRVLKLLDNPFASRLSRKHPAFQNLLKTGVLQQLDLEEDSGDSLEDFWEETSSYLSDEFNAGPLPRPRPDAEDL